MTTNSKIIQSPAILIIVIIVISSQFNFTHCEPSGVGRIERYEATSSIDGIVYSTAKDCLIFSTHDGHVLKLSLEPFKVKRTWDLNDVFPKNEDTYIGSSVMFPFLDRKIEYAMVCAKSHNGTCAAINLNNEREEPRRLENLNDTVHFLGSKASAVAFQLGYFSPNPLHQVYVGWEWDGRPLDSSPPFIRSLRYTSDQWLIDHPNSNIPELSSYVELYPDYKLKEPASFVYGFATQRFVYFLINTLQGVRLSRLDSYDSELISYTEIPLSCNNTNGISFDKAATAVYTNLSETISLDQRKEVNRSLNALYISFSGSSPQVGSLIRIYPINEIDLYFENALEDCARGLNTSERNPKVLRAIKLAGQCGESRDFSEFSVISESKAFVVGSLVLEGHAMAYLAGDQITTMQVVMEIDNAGNPTSYAAIVGTKASRIGKFSMENGSDSQLVYLIDSGTEAPIYSKSAINKNVVYFSADNILLQIPFSLDPDNPFGKSPLTALTITLIVCAILLPVAVLIFTLYRIPSIRDKIFRFFGWERRTRMEDPFIRVGYRPVAALINAQRRAELEAKGIAIYNFDTDMTVGGEIGSGKYGKVWRGTLTLAGGKQIDIAIKSFVSDDFNQQESANSQLEEAESMHALRHDNLLQLLGVAFDQAGAPLILLPYMPAGDLNRHIVNAAAVVTVRDVLRWSLDVARGMEYLAAHDRIHRDLAARNCMIDPNGTIKISDFGLSRNVVENGYYRPDAKSHYSIPIRSLPPECFGHYPRFTSATDVWSYGVLMWELFTRGATPYPDYDDSRSHFIITALRSDPDFRLQQPIGCPATAYEIMRRCWHETADQRPTFTDLIKEVKQLIENLDDTLLNQQIAPNKNRRAPIYANV